MANRTWLAVILCCLVWFVYMRWFAPPMVPPAGPQVATQAPSAASSGAGATSSPAMTQGSGIRVDGARTFSPFSTTPVVQESEKLASDFRDVFLSDTGGKVAAVRVAKYHQTLKTESPLIRSLDAETMPHSMGAFFTDPGLAELGFASFAKSKANGVVHFEKSHQGATVRKTLEDGQGEFFLNHEVRVKLPESDRTDWGHLIVPLGGVGLVDSPENPLEAWEAVAFQNETITRKALSDIKSGSEVIQGNSAWVAFGNRYFTNVVVNESELNPDIVFERSGEFTGVFLRYPLVTKPGENEVTYRFQLFSGPKDYAELALVPGMRQLIDYGMFSFLAYPLLELLRFFNRFVQNFGIAIILLTFVVRVLFYPLSLKSYRSMKAMQKLQPQIAALKEKYKDDAQKFGQEQMALFRAHKVNPAGGCLPILVQLPVFIALYSVLQNSIELFHAPFFWWIQDLSAKDPFYVFPVLMGISMFLQQKMTPTPGMDPMQQKIMLLMPVVFTVIMLSLPSGLTIYIFVSTLLGILQQVLMNREQDKPAKLAPAPSPQQGK